MRKPFQNDWFVWGEWHTIPWFHACYVFGLALDLNKKSGSNLKHVIADYDGKIQRVFVSQSEWQNAGKKYFRKIIKNSANLEQNLKDVEYLSRELFTINKKLLSFDPGKLTLPGMAILYKQFHRAKHELWSSGMVANLLELNQSFLSDYLRSYIRFHAGRFVSQEEWQILISPLKLSYIQQEEIDLLKLTVKIQKNRNISRRIIGSKKVSKTLGQNKNFLALFYRHFNNYRWTQYGWMGPALTLNYFEARLLGLLKEKNASRLLTTSVKNRKTMGRKQKWLENHLNIDAKHKRLLYALRHLLFNKTLRVDALYQGYYAWHPYMTELSKRTSIPIKILYNLHGKEIDAIFEGAKPSKKQIQRTKGYSVLVKEKSNLIFYEGSKAKIKSRQAVKTIKNLKPVQELKGQIAHNGQVIGTVKVVYSAKNINKIRSGDILVSTATDPSILPAMKKAAAFITDMGGLTAHAAIVARELKKPCIVGTQIATKILKDGDLVEVDANKGIVRKIK